MQATLSQVALPELGTLRRTLLGWLASADASGLDEDGVVALCSSWTSRWPCSTRWEAHQVSLQEPIPAGLGH